MSKLINRYDNIAISLHWLIALLILIGLSMGMIMTDLVISPTKLRLYSYHKWIGMSILLLAILRLVWRYTHHPPELPENISRWEFWLARITHYLLYGLMIVTPLAGWLMTSAKGVPVVWFGILPIPDLIEKNKELAEIFHELHEVLAWSLLFLISLHILASLKHHFWDRNNLLSRMWPWFKSNK